MGKNHIRTMKMVRAIRDRIYKETRGHIRATASTILKFSCLLTIFLVPSASPLPAADSSRGVLLDMVLPDGAGHRAGLEVADVLVGWRREANPPAYPQVVEGDLRSPFDLLDVETEQAPRGIVVLWGLRQGEVFAVRMPPGRWRITALPLTSPEEFLEFAQAARMLGSKRSEVGVEAVLALAANMRRRGDVENAVCLLYRAGWLVHNADRHEEARRLWAKALVAAKGSRNSQLVVWLGEAIGDLYIAQGHVEEAVKSHREALLLRESERPEGLAVARSLAKLGVVARQRGNLKAAEEHLRRALAILEKLAPGSLDSATSLNNLGTIVGARADMKTAEELFRQALTIREKLVPGSLELAGTLKNLGLLVSASGDFERAEELFRRAVAILEKHAPDSPAIVANLNELGLIRWRRGDLEEAEELFQRVVTIQEKHPESLDLAFSLTGLGLVRGGQSDLGEAEKLLSQALGIREKLAPDSVDVAASLANLAIIAGERSDLAEAEDLLRRALAIVDKETALSLELAAVFGSLGAVASQSGKLAEAEKYHQRALAMQEKLAPESLSVARSLHNLGGVASERGDLAAAERLYQRSLAITERLAPGSLEVASTLGAIAILATQRGDYLVAEDYCLRALKIHAKLAPDSLAAAGSLSTLAAVAHQRGDLEKAEDYYRRVLAIGEKIVPNSLHVAQPLGNLGIISSQRGELDAAERFLRRSLTIFERIAPGSLEVSLALTELGMLESKRGKWPAAEDSLNRALAITEQLAPDTYSEAEILYQLASVYRSTERLETAADLLGRAVDAIELQLGRLGGSNESRSEFRESYVRYYRDHIDVLMLNGRDEKAFNALESSRARSLLAMFGDRELLLAEEVPAELVREGRIIDQEYQQVRAVLAKMQIGVGKEQDGLPGRELMLELERLSRRRSELNERARAVAPRVAAVLYPRPFDLAATRAGLDPGTLLLSYSVGQEETHLFVVERSGRELQVETIALGYDQLGRQVTDWREGLMSGNAPARGGKLIRREPVLAKMASELARTLLLPVADRITKAERLLIIPDGPLLVLPFAALPCPLHDDSKPAHYLVECLPLHMVISATVYSELRKEHSRQKLVAFGDPVYPERAVAESANRVYLEPLPATRHEVEAIAALFPELAETRVGSEATEEQVKALGSGAGSDRNVSILHLACHGILDNRSPLSSFLALSAPGGGREGAEDGFLQVWEIVEQLHLDLDLVTLSACETGLGKEHGGEGLIGLTWGFHFAGASSVLASQWSVSDESTAELMTRFYEHLRAGKSKDEALRAAQLDLIRGRVEAWRDPFFWAAFQLHGDWMSR